MTIDGIEEICHKCGGYDLCIYVYGLPYCKPCFLEKRHNSKKFRDICQEIGITNLERFNSE